MPTPRPDDSARGFFAYHLKRLREDAELAQPALGTQIHVSGSLISGIETCTRRPGRRLCQALDKYFGVPMFFEGLYPRVIEETGLPAGFPEYTEAESAAAMIKKYENFVITGLFQTEEYARARLSAWHPPDRVEILLAERMARQEILKGENPTEMVVLFDASAIRRTFGDPEILRGQLEHLLKLTSEEHITIYVVPPDAPICPEGSFTILSTPGEPDTGYVESAGGTGRLIDDSRYVAEFGVLFERIRAVALSAADSERLIRETLEDL